MLDFVFVDFVSASARLVSNQITFGLKSKHLKGQLDPPVGIGHIFWIKGGQLDVPVGNVTFFLDQKRSAGPPCLVT